MKIFKKSIVALFLMTTPSATVGQTCRVDTLLQYMHDKGKSKHVMISLIVAIGVTRRRILFKHSKTVLTKVSTVSRWISR